MVIVVALLIMLEVALLTFGFAVLLVVKDERDELCEEPEEVKCEGEGILSSCPDEEKDGKEKGCEEE